MPQPHTIDRGAVGIAANLFYLIRQRIPGYAATLEQAPFSAYLSTDEAPTEAKAYLRSQDNDLFIITVNENHEVTFESPTANAPYPYFRRDQILKTFAEPYHQLISDVCDALDDWDAATVGSRNLNRRRGGATPRPLETKDLIDHRFDQKD